MIAGAAALVLCHNKLFAYLSSWTTQGGLLLSRFLVHGGARGLQIAQQVVDRRHGALLAARRTLDGGAVRVAAAAAAAALDRGNLAAGHDDV